MAKKLPLFIILLLTAILTADNPAHSANGKAAVLDEETLDLVRNAPAPVDLPGMSVAYLLMEEKDTLKEDFTAIYRIHIVWKILNKQAMPSGEVSIPFNSNESTLEIDLARTILPDNTVVNVAAENIREVTPYSGFPMYTSLKLKQFSMPAMEVGSVLEYKATLKFFKPVMPGYFYSYWSFPAGSPVKLSTFKIDIPVSIKAAYLARNTAIAPKIIEHGGRRIYTWTARDIFIGGIYEPYLPPYNEVCPNAVFVTSKGWGEIAKWFYDMAEPQMAPSDGMKEFVSKAMKSSGGDPEKVKKDLYNFVSGDIRYVAMSLKSSDYQPHKVADIFRDKYGDCKDKSALLISLYRLAGIEADFALLRTRQDGSINPDFPTLDFTHCIVALPKEGGGYLFLDPTLELNRFGYIPANLQNVSILVIKKDGYELVKIPFEYENINGVDVSLDMRIRDDYTIDINEKDIFSGDAEIMARLNMKYSVPDAVKADIEEALQSIYTKPKLISYDASDPNNLDEHFRIRSRYEVQDHIKEAGDLLILDLPNPLILNLNSTVTADKRTYALYFPSLYKDSTVIDILIPLGCRINYLPPDEEKDSAFGYYKREVSSNVDKITLKYYYKSKMIEVPAAQYGEFKSFVNGVVKSLKESIVFAKQKPAEEPVPLKTRP